MTRILRYVLFLPAAVAACIPAGVVGHWIGSFLGFGIFGGKEYLAWLLSGLGSASVFLFVGAILAPEGSENVKWLLLVTLVAIGLLSSIGALASGQDRISAIAGAVMFLVAITSVQIPAGAFSGRSS